jgi:hypothetical protein
MLTNSITGAVAGADHGSSRASRSLVAVAALASSFSAFGCGSSGTAERGEAPAPSSTVQSSNPPATPGADPGGGAPAAGSGNALLVRDNWVDAATNGVGVQGAFFVYVDHSNITTIAPTAGESETGYCVSGTAAQVVNMDFGNFFGAVAALNLSQQPGVDTPGAYDAAAHGVVGFGFDINGDTGSALRFVVKAFGVHDGYCINNVPECATNCSVEFNLNEMTQNCWTAGGALPPSNSLAAIEWQITTNENAPVPFDYCIENLHAVLAPVP